MYFKHVDDPEQCFCEYYLLWEMEYCKELRIVTVKETQYKKININERTNSGPEVQLLVFSAIFESTSDLLNNAMSTQITGTVNLSKNWTWLESKSPGL